MRGLLVGCVLVAVVGCEKKPTHLELAEKLKSKGVLIEMENPGGPVMTFSDRATGQRVVVTIASSAAAADEEVRKTGFTVGHGGAFSRGRYVVEARTPHSTPLLKRVMAAMD